MLKKKTRLASEKNSDTGKNEKISGNISYRLKCAKTANGLSHFVMYGDVPKEKSLL